MLGIIIAGLLFMARGSAAFGNSSHGNFSRIIIPLSSLPRVLIPLPTIITDLPTEILVDTDFNPSQAHTEYLKGREGAIIAAYLDPFTTFTDRSLASQCGSSWSSEYSDYVATGALTTFYPGGPKWYYPDWSFTINPPCCGVCQIDGINVDLSYWPTPAPTPVATALVNDVGFTFVSPSAYAVFRSLAAYDLCGRVGQTYKNKTLSFGPTELSTSPGINARGILFFPYDYKWTAFNYADITNSNCTNILVSSGGTETRYYNPCFPFLSLPPQVLNIDQRWSTCVHSYGAFYDPPRILAPVDGLTIVEAAQTSAVDAPQASQKATAGQAAALPVAASTPANAIPTPSKAHPQANSGLSPSSPPKAKPPPDTGPVNPKPNDSTPETPTLKDPAPKDPAPKDPTPKVPTPKEEPTSKNPTPIESTPKDPIPEDIKPGDSNPVDPKSKGPNISNPPTSNHPDPKVPPEATSPKPDPAPPQVEDSSPISPPDQAPDKAKQPQPGSTPLNSLVPDPQIPADPNPPKQGPGGSNAINPSPGDPSNPKVYVDSKPPGPDPASSNQPNHATEPKPVEQTSSSPGDPDTGNQEPGNPGPIAPNIYVQGLKVTEGASAITQAEKAIAYNSGYLHIGSSAIAVPTRVPPSYNAASSLNGLLFSVVADSPPRNPDPGPYTSDPVAPAIYVQGVKITEGEPVITQDGKQIAYSFGYLYIGSSAIAVPTLVASSYTAASNLNGLAFSIVANAPPISLSAEVQNPNPVTPAIYVQGVELTEGAPAITQGGIAIAYSSGYLHVGSNLVAIPQTVPPSFTSASALDGLSFSVIPFSGNALQENPSPPEIYVQGVRLTEGGPPITQDGKVIAYSSGYLHVGSSVVEVPTLAAPSYASASVVNGVTFSVVAPRPADVIPLPAPVLTIGHSLVTATPNFQIVVEGQTLIAGGAAQTVSGTRISLAPSASAIIIGSSTSLLASPSQTTAVTLTLGSSTYTATLSSNLAIGNQILSPGAAITVGGTPISLDAQGTDVVIGTGTHTQDISLGALIMGAFDPSPPGPLPSIVFVTPTLSPGQAAPSPPSTTLTVDNVALSLNPTQAIINNTPYPIDPSASPTTVVVGNETLSVGPGGVGFPSTTVPVPSAPGGGSEGFTGGAAKGLVGFGAWWWWLLEGMLGGWLVDLWV